MGPFCLEEEKFLNSMHFCEFCGSYVDHRSVGTPLFCAQFLLLLIFLSAIGKCIAKAFANLKRKTTTNTYRYTLLTGHL